MLRACKTKRLGDKRYRCSFELTLAVMGGKWKPIVLYHLAVTGVLRFSEFRRAIPEMTERMLSRQLKELEADGVVHREVYAQVPPKVEYSLTELGKSLTPILLAMRHWGAAYEERFGPAQGCGEDGFEQPAGYGLEGEEETKA